jgi:hypothetical protein
MPRWTIVFGNYTGVEGYAIRELNQLVQKYVPDIVRVVPAKAFHLEEDKEANLIFIGTTVSNSFFNRFAQEKKFSPPDPANKESYTISIFNNPVHPEAQYILLCGADENGTLYAVRDFEHYLVPNAIKVASSGEYIHQPFINPFEKTEISDYPRIPHRGLWTWGHVIYDYRRYLDNMSKWKMNIAVIWNDYIPINAKEIVTYAHERGIKIIWGYSWCWGEKLDPTAPGELEKWTHRVIEKYETEIKNTGADGIYFQIFTETYETTIQQKSIPELSVLWVNTIGRKLLEKYPGLWIQFGLHAISIKNNIQPLAEIDKRISIIWEDIGLPKPVFPFWYEPTGPTPAELTQLTQYTESISQLRGKQERVGLVIKGMTNLNWNIFAHLPNSILVGEYPEEFIRHRAEQKQARWNYIESCWKKELDCVQKIIGTMEQAQLLDTTILGLVEDGLWEEKMWLSVKLFAESMWNPIISTQEIIDKIERAG